MKKLFGLMIALVLAIGVLAGCGQKAPSSSEPESKPDKIEHSFDFEGLKADVTVDISGDWDCDFGAGSVYLYNEPYTESSEAVSYGFILSREEYDEQVDSLKQYSSWDEVGAGFIGVDEDGDARYLFYVGGEEGSEVYFMITADSSVDANDVFGRYLVSLPE